MNESPYNPENYGKPWKELNEIITSTSPDSPSQAKPADPITQFWYELTNTINDNDEIDSLLKSLASQYSEEDLRSLWEKLSQDDKVVQLIFTHYTNQTKDDLKPYKDLGKTTLGAALLALFAALLIFMLLSFMFVPTLAFIAGVLAVPSLLLLAMGNFLSAAVVGGLGIGAAALGVGLTAGFILSVVTANSCTTKASELLFDYEGKVLKSMKPTYDSALSSTKPGYAARLRLWASETYFREESLQEQPVL